MTFISLYEIIVMTLHEAIEIVLKDAGHSLPAKEIAYMVNKQKLVYIF